MTGPNEFSPIDLARFPHVAESRTPMLATATYNATAQQPPSPRTRLVRVKSLRAIRHSCARILSDCETASEFTAEVDRWSGRTARELRVAIAAMDAPTGLPGDLVPELARPAHDLFTNATELRHVLLGEAGAVQHVVEHLLEADSTVASLTSMWNSGFAGQPMPPPPNFEHIRDCLARSLDIVSSAAPTWKRQIRATASEALTLIDLACELMAREHSAALGQRRNDGR